MLSKEKKKIQEKNENLEGCCIILLHNVSLESHSILRTLKLDMVGKSSWMQSSMKGEVENQSLYLYSKKRPLLCLQELTGIWTKVHLFQIKC